MILICLFVSFEVKSKEIVFQCDGVLENTEYSFHSPHQKILSKSSREHTQIYYLNERKKYLGEYDKKERKSGSKKRLLKLIKRKFEKSDEKFGYSITYDLRKYEEVKRGEYRKEINLSTRERIRYEKLPGEFWTETFSLNRYSSKIRHRVTGYKYKPYVYNEPRITWEELFTGNCKKVDRKF